MRDGDGTFFVSGFWSEFFASGGFERTDFTNGSSELIDFNERLQPFFRRAFGAHGTFMMLSYDFTDPGGDNDGNLHSIRTPMVDWPFHLLLFSEAAQSVRLVEVSLPH